MLRALFDFGTSQFELDKSIASNVEVQHRIRLQVVSVIVKSRAKALT